MIAWAVLSSVVLVYATISRLAHFHHMAAPRKGKGHHPDYAKIAELERELGIGEPVAEPLPVPMVRQRPAPPTAGPVVQKPDNVCASCIRGRPPAHGCIFFPVCQQ